MKLIILDRDGVINQDSDAYIKSPEEWEPIAGSLDAIAALTKAGYTIAVATNQSGIGRGLYDEDMLKRIHQKMLTLVQEAGGAIDFIVYCPHLPTDHCDCRKPKPGLLNQIAKHYQINLAQVYYAGDKQSDVEAAIAAGCKPILLKTGYGEQTLKEYPDIHCPIFSNLKSMVDEFFLEGIYNNKVSHKEND